LNTNKILASSCRRKILKTLSQKKETTIMKLVRTVNSTYNEVDRNLRILEREAIITQRHAGHKRKIRLNLENERTLVLLKLLKIRENSVNLKHLRKSLKGIMENNNTSAKHLT
jgi:predicted transcriptional regulator